MLAEIVTIGDEILIGQITDTNSAWLATELNLKGIKVHRITSIADTREAILTGLSESHQRADLIIMTGGLGPTKDDITKSTLAEYFDTELVLNEEVLEDVKRLFRNFNVEMPAVNRKQAEVPASSTVIRNRYGTAPGMWFEKEGKIYISLPGVPFEMKGLMQNDLLERVGNHFETPSITHRTVLTQGVGESSLMEKITDWENSLEEQDIKLAYLPSAGRVRLRLSIYGEKEETALPKIEGKIRELEELIPQYIFGYDNDTLEEVTGKLLRDHGLTMGTAESCTGGYIAHLITSISGSSEYFLGSVVSYANEVKVNSLGVNPEDIEEYGAVSEPVVEQMALGAKKLLDVDCVIATSGIAGPTGGTDEKPVGTVWIAVSTPYRTVSRKFNFGKNRERNIQRTALTALNWLRKEILKGST